MKNKFSELWPSPQSRTGIQESVITELNNALMRVQTGSTTGSGDIEKLRETINAFDFNTPQDLSAVAKTVIGLLEDATVHTMHPGYFGLFNPSVTFAGVIADQITATLNPQLAVWSHAPAAIEIERFTIQAIGSLFNWPKKEITGHFTTGGAEANFTSLLMALTKYNTEYADAGVWAYQNRPTIYVSKESHLAWYKFAHHAGIGRESVRLVDTDGLGRMNPDSLQALITNDKASGFQPIFIGATAGTTNAGMIDPLVACGHIAKQENLWFHVDAAWGGAAAVLPELRSLFAGIEVADSITVDAHKWFAVPMGAGIFLCKDNKLLGETFRVKASYMPKGDESLDPYTHSIQWSRRFIGLKLFMSLATLGWQGYQAHVASAISLASQLKMRLEQEGWSVVNDSPLAVVCFVDAKADLDLPCVSEFIVSKGNSWISSAKFEGKDVLRACISSHFSTTEHIEILLNDLNEARGK